MERGNHHACAIARSHPGARGWGLETRLDLIFDLACYWLAMSVATRREQPQAATYSKRLKDSIKSILDNYGEILKASKVSFHHVKIIQG